MIIRSVVTSTRVRDSSSAVRTRETFACAVPVPRFSFPVPLITAVWRDSSLLRNEAVPPYTIDTGPSLTFTLPLKSSPSTDSRVAPGMHGAIASTSRSVCHAVSASEGTVNEFSSCIRPPLLRGNRLTRCVVRWPDPEAYRANVTLCQSQPRRERIHRSGILPVTR